MFNLHGDECNLRVDSTRVVGTENWVASGRIIANAVGFVETSGDTDDSNDELTHSHTKSSPNEKRATAEDFHGIERNWGEDCVDQVENEGNEESIGNSTSRLEERRGVVEDEVDTWKPIFNTMISLCASSVGLTSPLLHHLQRSTENGLPQVRVGLPQ